MLRHCVHASVFALLLSSGGAVFAQSYPMKSIRFIVPFSAGGGADIVARAIAQKLGEATAQQVVVDNRAGAAAIIGMDLAAKAPADGYTMVLGQTGPNSINPALYKKLPYDAAKDFAPVTLTTTYPYVLGSGDRIAGFRIDRLARRIRSGEYAAGCRGTAQRAHRESPADSRDAYAFRRAGRGTRR